MSENLTESFDKAKEAEQAAQKCITCFNFKCTCEPGKLTPLRPLLHDQSYDCGTGV